MTLVDTNVLIDLAADDPVWGDWSEASLEAAARRGPVWINDVVYAEFAVRYDTMDELDAFLAAAQIEMIRMPKAALFLAGKVFGKYRRSGGTRSGVLPDFFVGAHAETAHLLLLTRDTRRYRTYFPKLALIAP